MGAPSRAATATPVTLAEAPMGVAMPPMSVPLETVQVSVCRSIPRVSARESRTGTITAAMGTLSTKAEAMATNQMSTTTVRTGWPPASLARTWARPLSRPVCSRPLTVRNRPTRKPRVFHSTCLSRPQGYLVVQRVAPAARIPMEGMVRPVRVWVAMSSTTAANSPTRTQKIRRFGMASLGSISHSSGATPFSRRLSLL